MRREDEMVADGTGVAGLASAADGARAEVERRVRDVLTSGGPDVVFQPVVDLRRMQLVGVEALARFGAHRPDDWLADAHAVGLGVRAELAVLLSAVRRAAEPAARFPEGARLWVNVSPEVLCAPELIEVVRDTPVPLTVEVTEHARVADYAPLHRAVDRLRAEGAWLAVDDAGAGYSSFRHVLRLRPEAIKMDMSITRGIEHDPARAELAGSLVRMARQLGALLVAEGVETRAELDALLSVGVAAAQGHYLARPGPLPVPAHLQGPTPRLSDVTHTRRTSAGEGALEDVVRPVLEAVLHVTGLESAYLTVLHPGRTWLEHRFVCNTGGLQVPEGLTIPWIDSLCKRCRDLGLLWTADVPGDLPPAPDTAGQPIRTFVSIPVVLPHGEVAGTLCALGTRSRYLASAEVAELEMFAGVLARRMQPADLAVPAPRTAGPGG
jgi:EAL domain-containing protein (putative c-di-GMP-specific phosphodiesterase class I)